MSSRQQGPALVATLLLCTPVAPGPAAAQPPSGLQQTIPGVAAMPPEVLALLQVTRETYGRDAMVLQVQLLHHAVHADSVLPAGVRVSGIEARPRRRYLRFGVETGIVFDAQRMDRRQRVSHLWSVILLPALARLDTYDMPADGIVVELSYFHQPYKDGATLEEVVPESPGTGERTTFYLLHPDVLAFRRHDIDGSQLYSRSHPHVDAAPFTQSLVGDE